MKRSNKIKILAGAASFAALSAPIITLASCGCSKGSDITIDEKEKQKELESGKREATYEFKLGSKIAAGETVEATLSNIESSQTGYTVDVRNVLYEEGNDTVKVVTGITTAQNELLKEGSTFSFTMTIVKKDSSGKQTWSSNIEGFKMTYAVPTKQGLTIAEEAKDTYTDPAEKFHSYVFEVGSTISVDEQCTFECDITRQTSEKSGLAVKFNKAEPIASNKQLSTIFELVYSGSAEAEQDDMVEFDFTLSCVKNGEELWRQSFTNFKLSYLYHQMWIFPEYQWDSTYAGENEFHIYVVKNKDLHWGGAYNVGIEFANPSHPLEIDTTIGVQELTTEQGTSYFDIPVKLTTPVSADTDVSFKPTLKWTQPGQDPQTLPFDTQTVTFYTTKIDTYSSIAKALETEQKTHKYEFNMVDSSATLSAVEVEELHQYDASTDTTISISKAEPTTGKVLVVANINTNLIDAFGEFKFILKGTTAEGKTWSQKIGYENNNHLKFNYLDPVTVSTKEVKTALDARTASFTYRWTDGASKTADLTSKNLAQSEDVTSFTATQGSGNTISVQIAEPSTLYDYKTWVSFDAEFPYSVTKDGLTKTGTKTISGFKVTYNGTVVLNDSQRKTTNPGERTQIFKFRNLSGLTNIQVSVAKTFGPDAYNVRCDAPTVTKDEILLPVTITTKTEYIDDAAYCYFKPTFTAYDGSKQAWSKELAEELTITYAAGFTCADKKTLETSVSRYNSTMAITAPSALKTGESYSISISSQSSTRGVTVTLGTHTTSGNKINQALTLSKSAGAMWADGDNANFDLIIKKTDASGKTLCCERMQGCIVKYLEAEVTWDPLGNWYMTEINPQDTRRTVTTPIHFTLKRPLEEGEELHFQYSVRKEGDATPMTPDREGDIVNTNGTDAWINFFFQYPSGFYAGFHCVYDLTFKCYKDSKVIWEKTVTDWYLYFLAGIKEPATKELTTTTQTASITFDLTGTIDPTIWGTTLTFTPQIVKTGGTANLEVESSGAPTLDSTTHKAITQGIKFKTNAATGEYVEFKIQYEIKLIGTGATYVVDTGYIEGFKLTQTA